MPSNRGLLTTQIVSEMRVRDERFERMAVRRWAFGCPFEDVQGPVFGRAYTRYVSFSAA